jgi:hypothetical protein
MTNLLSYENLIKEKLKSKLEIKQVVEFSDDNLSSESAESEQNLIVL